MRFSRRTGWDLEESSLWLAIENAKRAHRVTDLTASNPTLVIESPDMVAALGHPRGAAYEPTPRGAVDARAAIAHYYAQRNLRADPERLVLSASTSEAYAWLFKLLCDDGDRVLVPTPSYPLFGYLAGLEDVDVAPYSLSKHANWRIERDSLERAVDARTRAIVIVHPNNPTGSFVDKEDAAFLQAFAASHDLALVADEVFMDYPHGTVPAHCLRSFIELDRTPTFVLSGLSKVAALPQLKLGWMHVSGPDAFVKGAMARLEMIADTYLSVSTPVQLAAAEILASCGRVQDGIRGLIAANLAALDRALVHAHESAIRRLPCEGGWCAILEVPRTRTDEEWVEVLLHEEGVLVYPGYFFDLEPEGHIVLSLLVDQNAFAHAAQRIVSRLAL